MSAYLIANARVHEDARVVEYAQKRHDIVHKPIVISSSACFPMYGCPLRAAAILQQVVSTDR